MFAVLVITKNNVKCEGSLITINTSIYSKRAENHWSYIWTWRRGKRKKNVRNKRQKRKPYLYMTLFNSKACEQKRNQRFHGACFAIEESDKPHCCHATSACLTPTSKWHRKKESIQNLNCWELLGLLHWVKFSATYVAQKLLVKLHAVCQKLNCAFWISGNLTIKLSESSIHNLPFLPRRALSPCPKSIYIYR